MVFLGLCAILPAGMGQSAGMPFLKDAPADPVVDHAHLLTTEQRDILRENIQEAAQTYGLYIYVMTSDFTESPEAHKEATRTIHHWAPSGYVVLAHFSSLPGVEPVMAYSQDITVKLSKEQKEAIHASLLEYWKAGTEPGEKVLMAARHLTRNSALWETWYKPAEALREVAQSASFNSRDVVQEDGEVKVREVQRQGKNMAGDAEKVQQAKAPVFFDWQKQMMVINAALVIAILGGALYFVMAQRKANLEREEQMRRGAEMLTPIEPVRRRPPTE